MALVKIVYFDEESASDLLDIAAGGKEETSTERVKERGTAVEAEVNARMAAKFSWLPFIGASAEVATAASASSVGRSIFNKTLSNTILTDYLGKLSAFEGVEELTQLRLSAPKGSAAFMKMYTPYMAMLKMDDLPVNLAMLDEALQAAKGYYELLAEKPNGSKCILRFNISAFRNRYALVDLGRMTLLFHGVKVGEAAESSLEMRAEMFPSGEELADVEELLDGAERRDEKLLAVYDVLLAGVEHAGGES